MAPPEHKLVLARSLVAQHALSVQQCPALQAYLKHCLRYILDHCTEDLEFFAQQNDKTLLQRIQVHSSASCIHSAYTLRTQCIHSALAWSPVLVTFQLHTWFRLLQSSKAQTTRCAKPASQTGFTAQPCIDAKRQLIASSFTVGDIRKGL